MTRLIAIAAVLLLVVPCSGEIFTVDDDGPADYASLQAAIDASWHGDTIIVRPGTYREQVRFHGRQVTVRSQDPGDPAVVQTTIVRGDSAAGASGASILFDFGEPAGSVLEGFTITGQGILCSGASPTIVGNVIRDCGGPGIRGQNNAAPTILANEIVSNTLEGIHFCGGLIQGNTIAGNSAGIAFCSGQILDNLISDNGGGGGMYSCDAEIAGNRIVGNWAASKGGGLYGCGGQIHNNIIAGNWAEEAGGGLYDCRLSICSNTIVGNRAGERGGAISDCPGTVCNNVIAMNDAPAAGGIYGPCGNTYNALWRNTTSNFGGGAAAGNGEIAADPVFAREGHWDDHGTTNPADDVWVDGDFHLQSQAGRWEAQAGRWVQDSVTSHCIDAGKPSSLWTGELWPHGKRVNLGAYGGTAEASLSPADLGRAADLDNNEYVGPWDLMRLADKWLVQRDLLAEDLNRDGMTDFNDFAMLAQYWRVDPPAPAVPLPDPMTWAIQPHATGPYSIAMIATTATSTDGTGVEYYFEDVFDPQFNSGWLRFGPNEDPLWEDTDLKAETLYWYRVKARNQGNGLETGWTERAGATTAREDSEPPLPNPMTWATEPFGISADTIRMVASTATDESGGVQYYFECTSDTQLSSGWQDSPIYEVGPVARGYYEFRVRARDELANQTIWSAEVAVDLEPPTPDPMEWEVQPTEVQVSPGTFGYGATMTAVEATDKGAEVQYYFECTSDTRFSSGWQTSRTYTVTIGPKGKGYRFRVKARDMSPSHNETAWSGQWPAL